MSNGTQGQESKWKRKRDGDMDKEQEKRTTKRIRTSREARDTGNCRWEEGKRSVHEKNGFGGFSRASTLAP